jgi:hypothetical protein
MEGRWSSRSVTLGVDSVNAVEITLGSFLTHASIVISFGRSGLDGSPASKQA